MTEVAFGVHTLRVGTLQSVWARSVTRNMLRRRVKPCGESASLCHRDTLSIIILPHPTVVFPVGSHPMAAQGLVNRIGGRPQGFD